MSDGWVSYSELMSHRTCPQRWNYGYLRRLQKVDPDDVKVEMEFGNWWHALRAADSIERGRRYDSLKALPKELSAVDGGPTWNPSVVTVDEIHASAHDWWREQTPHVQDTWDERIGEGLPGRLLSLDDRWRDQWATDIENERPLAVELFWKRPLPALPQPDGTHRSPGLDLLGYVDEIYLDVGRQVVVVRDHKTSKALSTQSAVDDMLDSQLQFYAWGASPTVTSWGLGPIRATAYDRVCSVRPVPPKVTTAGRLAVRDGQPSVSGCDLATYIEWSRGPDGQGVPYLGRKPVGGEAAVAGYYQAETSVIEKLSAPSWVSAWFQRTLTPLNNNLIKTHLRAAVDSAVDLQLTAARAEQTHEAARNLGSGCRWCDFVGLCRAEMVGGADGEYELSDYHLRARA